MKIVFFHPFIKSIGVPEIQLSDSQSVYIYPEKQEITFRKNRDFIFSGKIHAGLFDFYSKNGLFEYDKFKLALPTIDSMSFTVRSNYDKVNNFYRQIRVKTVIADISGELLIDDPNNKSGSKSFPEYPYFTNKNDAYVYFDNKSIQNGVYNREKFKYHVYPFTIDSLDNFTTEGLKMDGNLASGGIFPVIEEPLTIQADYSLGFIHETPEWLRPEEITTENQKKIQFSNNSYAEAKASSPNAGRGDSPTMLAVLVNIFGGIVRCDRIANGIIEATKITDVNVPVIVRLDGTNAPEAAEILKNANIPNLIVGSDLGDGAAKAVAAAKQA